MAILEVDDLSLELGGRRILDGLTVEFWEGHIHAFIGPNGAGKSTLANTLMGLEGYTHFQGDIRLDGESLRDVAVDERARRGLTLAWQEPARFEGLPVRSFIQASAREKSQQAVDDALEAVGLAPAQYRDRAVDRSLSGGERKRVELACILAMDPRIVLMDEPDSGIDVEALNRIFEVLQVLKERGATVIMITHSLTVLRQAEHAFLMCCGKVVDKGGIDKIAHYFEDRCIPCDHPNRPSPEELA